MHISGPSLDLQKTQSITVTKQEVPSILSDASLANADLTPDGVSPIWTKSQLESDLSFKLPLWASTAHQALVERLRDPRFPCFFASAAERRGLLMFAFAGSATEERDIRHVHMAIRMYLDGLEGIPRAEADMSVLILMLPPCLDGTSLQAYADEAWTLLDQLHQRDEKPWPAGLPTDVDDPRWSFALAGVPLFVNVSTPANEIRKSRNVGPSLAFIISPREVFDRVAGPNEQGRRVRLAIRRRAADYDGIPSAPWTTSYGDGGSGGERKQYLLPDNNDKPVEVSQDLRVFPDDSHSDFRPNPAAPNALRQGLNAFDAGEC